MQNRKSRAAHFLTRKFFAMVSFVIIVVVGAWAYINLNTIHAVASESEDAADTKTEKQASYNNGSSIESILSDSDALCVVAINAKKHTSISITDRSTINARSCMVHSNSGNGKSIGVFIEENARLYAPVIYGNGKFVDNSGKANSANFYTSKRIADPLQYLVAPQVDECDHRDIRIRAGINRLSPGVYCGGIIALGDSTIELEPGIYILKNGPLVLGGQASISGRNTGFYFTGSNSVLNLGVSSRIELTAPVSGPMAGVIFFEDRKSPYNREFIIRSGNAQLLEGAIYLSKGKFVADAAAQIGQKSQWTALVANKIELRNSANVDIKSDYSASEIPVPEGIWPGIPVATLTN